LSEVEKKKVFEMLNSDRFQDQTPRQVYATLLDEGRYLCHWRTMYRILKEQGQVCERRQQRQHPTYTKPLWGRFNPSAPISQTENMPDFAKSPILPFILLTLNGRKSHHVCPDPQYLQIYHQPHQKQNQTT
jgi:hypothetical protein